MNLFSWSLIADGFLFSPTIKRYLGRNQKLAVLVTQNDSGSWGVDINDWDQLGAELNRRLEKKQLDVGKLTREHLAVGQRLFKLCNVILPKNLKQISTSELSKWLKTLAVDCVELNGLGFMPVISDFDHNLLSTKLIAVLEKHETDPLAIQSHMSLLISTDKPDLNWQETLELLKLLSKHKTVAQLKQAKEFKQHVQNFAWINFGYIGPLWTEKDFLDRAKKILATSQPVKSQYLEHKNHFKNLKLKQSRLEKHLRLTNQERYLFSAARTFMFLKAYRLNVRHKVQYVCELIFKELSQRLNLPVNTFRYSNWDELAELSHKPANLKRNVWRRTGVVEITEHGKKRMLVLSKAKALLKKLELKETITKSAEVRGQAAFLGKVQGRAKIVFGTKYMQKVGKGDILIAITTTPDLLPAMYLAAAFVTDSGGITSHAAIVAREMKKPCVIGTKIATKIFKDGDLLEVDANKGMVKKI